jgi:outer membrane receptor protein involved in Fe transport
LRRSDFTTLTGKYHNLLPSFDSDMDVTLGLKVRASYGETIGRPRYDQIQGGQSTLTSLVRMSMAAPARAGNPALKPVKSKNLDLSASGTTASKTWCPWACSTKT